MPLKKYPAIKKTMTPVIASRKLELELEGKIQKITIKIGSPIQDVKTATGLDWRCPFKISGIPQKFYYACGIDSVQALSLAFARIHLCLTEIESEYKTKIKFLGAPNHAFPETNDPLLQPNHHNRSH